MLGCGLLIRIFIRNALMGSSSGPFGTREPGTVEARRIEVRELAPEHPT